MTLSNIGTLHESVLDDIFINKYHALTEQMAALALQLKQLDDLSEHYYEVERQYIPSIDEIGPLINDSEQDLLIAALEFSQEYLQEYQNLYTHLPQVPHVFTEEEQEQIQERLKEYETEDFDLD